MKIISHKYDYNGFQAIFPILTYGEIPKSNIIPCNIIHKETVALISIDDKEEVTIVEGMWSHTPKMTETALQQALKEPPSRSYLVFILDGSLVYDIENDVTYGIWPDGNIIKDYGEYLLFSGDGRQETHTIYTGARGPISVLNNAYSIYRGGAVTTAALTALMVATAQADNQAYLEAQREVVFGYKFSPAEYYEWTLDEARYSKYRSSKSSEKFYAELKRKVKTREGSIKRIALSSLIGDPFFAKDSDYRFFVDIDVPIDTGVTKAYVINKQLVFVCKPDAKVSLEDVCLTMCLPEYTVRLTTQKEMSDANP